MVIKMENKNNKDDNIKWIELEGGVIKYDYSTQEQKEEKEELRIIIGIALSTLTIGGIAYLCRDKIADVMTNVAIELYKNSDIGYGSDNQNIIIDGIGDTLDDVTDEIVEDTLNNKHR